MNRAVSDRRLLKLAAFLRTVPPKRFNYTHWVGMDWKGKQDLSCGTTACALGWAATMPCFRRLGLRFFDPYGDGFEGHVIIDREEFRADDHEAAVVVFGITPKEAVGLFTPGHSVDGEYNSELHQLEKAATPKHVARKIEKFVKERAEREGRARRSND